MRELSNCRDRDEIGTTPPGDEPVADADSNDDEGKVDAFGMWKDRHDMADVDAWIRNMRRDRFSVC